MRTLCNLPRFKLKWQDAPDWESRPQKGDTCLSTS